MCTWKGQFFIYAFVVIFEVLSNQIDGINIPTRTRKIKQQTWKHIWKKLKTKQGRYSERERARNAEQKWRHLLCIFSIWDFLQEYPRHKCRILMFHTSSFANTWKGNGTKKLFFHPFYFMCFASCHIHPFYLLSFPFILFLRACVCVVLLYYVQQFK